MWQSKSKNKEDGDWKGVSMEYIERTLSSCYHHPSIILLKMKNSGYIVSTKYSLLRFIKDIGG